MLYTNVKSFGTTKPAKMIELIKKSKWVVVDTETYAAAGFDAQAIIDNFLSEKIQAGKKITEVTKKSAVKYMEEIKKEYALDPKRNKIRLLQVATDKGDYIICDLQQAGTDKVVHALESVTYWLGQNLKFDLKELYYHYGLESPQVLFDVMIGHRLVKNGEQAGYFSADLQSVVRYWENVELEKGFGGSDWSGVISKAQFKYAVEDIKYIKSVADQQIAVLNDIGICQDADKYGDLIDTVSIIEMKFVDVLARIELAGIPMNIPALKKRLAESAPELAKLRKKLPKDLNTQSSVQIIEYLDKHGIDAPGAAKEDLLRFLPNPIIVDLLRVKTLQKEIQMLEDYINVWTVDGRLYPSYNGLRGTAGRTSSSEPNAQQFPRALKALIYRSTKQRVVLRGDYPGIEMRIMAHLACDVEMTKIFADKLDAYIATAAKLLDKALADVTKEERQRIKGACLGFIYGMGPKKFLEYAFNSFGLVFTLEEAEELRAGYFRIFTGVKGLHNKHSAMLKENREITLFTMLGRRMRCDKFTNANNYPDQGTGAEMIKLAMVIFSNRCKREKCDAFIVNHIHDELVIEAARSQKKLAAKILKEAMEASVNFILTEFHTEVEIEEVPI